VLYTVVILILHLLVIIKIIKMDGNALKYK